MQKIIMNIPQELKPTDTFDVSLLNGRTVALPLCHPIFSLWNGSQVNFSYGNKPILNHKGEACFAELYILKILLEQGWNGVWVETYGGTHYLRTMPSDWKLKKENEYIPKDKEEILKGIWKAAKTTACFDVFAWKNDQILFCEAKHMGKDRLTKPQLKFIEGSLACGILPESLLIVEWREN